MRFLYQSFHVGLPGRDGSRKEPWEAVELSSLDMRRPNRRVVVEEDMAAVGFGGLVEDNVGEEAETRGWLSLLVLATDVYENEATSIKIFAVVRRENLERETLLLFRDFRFLYTIFK